METTMTPLNYNNQKCQVWMRINHFKHTLPGNSNYPHHAVVNYTRSRPPLLLHLHLHVFLLPARGIFSALLRSWPPSTCLQLLLGASPFRFIHSLWVTTPGICQSKAEKKLIAVRITGIDLVFQSWGHPSQSQVWRRARVRLPAQVQAYIALQSVWWERGGEKWMDGRGKHHLS